MTLTHPRPVQTDAYKKIHCRYCEAVLPEPFLDLGVMPLANSFLKREELKEPEFTCPLSLVWCPSCHLVQLSHGVPPAMMFSHYVYVSSTTQTFRQHFSEYASRAKAKLGKRDSQILAVDIGSNDGLLVSCYQKEGMKAAGIEPARNLSEDANQKGFTTLNDYFRRTAVQRILKDFGPVDIVSANNVFAHIDDIHDVCRNLKELLHAEGIFIIEFPYLVTMFEKMLFDMIYHEHLSYIAVKPLQLLLERFQLEIFDIETVASHGGSLRVFVQKKGASRPISLRVETLVRKESKGGYDSAQVYQEFARRVYGVRDELVGVVKKIRSNHQSLSGYGAPAKGNTLINFCRFTDAKIDYLVDDNSLKQDLFAPGSRIPVVSSRVLFENPTNFVLIFAWNFAQEILKKLKPLRQRQVQFLIPLPRPRIL